jgi:hypothetical protein
MSIQQPGLAVAHRGGSDGWRLGCLRCFRAQPERERLNPQLLGTQNTDPKITQDNLQNHKVAHTSPPPL